MLKLLRKTHLYVGVFIAPALLFFAFTGALQTFSLHESKGGKDYTPPAWIVTLAQVHKNQTDIVRKPGPPKPTAPKPTAAAQTDKPLPAVTLGTSPAPKPADAPKPKSHLPLKIFFLLVSIGLFISTLTGIYMSYKYERNKGLVTGLLIAGIVIPLFLLRF